MAEKFSNEIIEEAWSRTNGCCERCGTHLVKKNRGRGCGSRGCWEAHHKNRSKSSCLSNCEILCVNCHIDTKSFGKHIKK